MSTRQTRFTAAAVGAALLHTVQCIDDVAQGQYYDGTKVAYKTSNQIMQLGRPTFDHLQCLILENARPSPTPQGLTPQDILGCLLQLQCVQSVVIRNMLPVIHTVAPPQQPLHELRYISKFVMEEHPHSMRYILSHLRITHLVRLVELTVGRLFPAEGDNPDNGLLHIIPPNFECLPMLPLLTHAEIRNRPTDGFAEIVAEILDKNGKKSGGKLALRMRAEVYPHDPMFPSEQNGSLLRALHTAFTYGSLTAARTSLNTLVLELNPIIIVSRHWGALFAQYPWLHHLVFRSIEFLKNQFSNPWRILDGIRGSGENGINCPGLQSIVLDLWANMDTLTLELEECLRVRFTAGAVRLRKLVVVQKPLPPGAVERRTLGQEYLGRTDKEKYVGLLTRYVGNVSITIDGRRYA
ncbi:hypothetical protein C8Q73DRAFT_220865 [Cubamyces lactineus]|nr:hypothetical protein C8Q73DRAFT_220865 [Cubamyces lactineus]